MAFGIKMKHFDHPPMLFFISFYKPKALNVRKTKNIIAKIQNKIQVPWSKTQTETLGHKLKFYVTFSGCKINMSK